MKRRVAKKIEKRINEWQAIYPGQTRARAARRLYPAASFAWRPGDRIEPWGTLPLGRSSSELLAMFEREAAFLRRIALKCGLPMSITITATLTAT